MSAPKTWLPDRDFDVSNLSRRQAAVFEHLCLRAAAGIQRDIDMYASLRTAPLASDYVKSEARGNERSCQRELDHVFNLRNRLRAIRGARLSKEEAQRVAEARRLKPDLSAEEVELVIYDMLAPADLSNREAA